MNYILEYKWALLLSLEVIAWLFTILMFYARYWIESSKLFAIFTVIAVVTGWVPHITLGIMNIVETRRIGTFEGTIVLLLVYGFTFGKKHLASLDEWMKKKAERIKQKRES